MPIDPKGAERSRKHRVKVKAERAMQREVYRVLRDADLSDRPQHRDMKRLREMQDRIRALEAMGDE